MASFYNAAIGEKMRALNGVFLIARGITTLAFDVPIPALGQPLLVELSKWLLAGLLIFPQTVLLGMTIPLMSAGVTRLFPDLRGNIIASLYFTNSIGATIGVLVSGFYLVGALGLPGTVRIAGLINITLAFVVFLLARNAAASPKEPAQNQRNPGDIETGALARLFFVAAFITGAASFIYEIGWIRMLSLILGSSIHSFELMLRPSFSAWLWAACGCMAAGHRCPALGRPDSRLCADHRLARKLHPLAYGISRLMSSRLFGNAGGDRINLEELTTLDRLYALVRLSHQCPTASDGAQWIYTSRDQEYPVHGAGLFADSGVAKT